METTDTTRIQDTAITSAVENKIETVNNAKAGRKVMWKDVLVGGVPGIALGAAGTFITTDLQARANEESDSTLQSGEGEAKIYDMAPIAHSVNDEMTFSEAFEAAREEVGAGGVFVWHGNAYGTYYQSEWASMDDEQRHEYSQSVSSAIHPDDAHPSASGSTASNTVVETSAENQEPVAHEDVGDRADDDFADEEPQGEPDIRVYEVEAVEGEDGTVQNVGYATVDGQDAMFVDVNDDGQVDVLAVDVNNDGLVQDNELMSLEDSGMTVGDLAVAASLENQMPGESIYDGAPDYTNDADVSDLA